MTAAIIGGIASALGDLGKLWGKKKELKQDSKNKDKELKEQRYRTHAELLNSSLERGSKSAMKHKEERNLMRARQAHALQEMAAGFRASLLGGK